MRENERESERKGGKKKIKMMKSEVEVRRKEDVRN